MLFRSGGKWNFENIYKLNYFIKTANERYNAGRIAGNDDHIRHYIGEGYFLRAQEYFFRLKKLGDFPIVTEPLADDHNTLVDASHRSPRNEVARFILSDLDNAIELLLSQAPQGGKTRISLNAAYLLKARVALFEATWLKYHAGTAMVPRGEGWPGAAKSYNSSYNFPSGSIDAEIKFFLQEAMAASKVVADNISLTDNNKETITEDFSLYNKNNYYDMFSSDNPAGYAEVLMWRQYKTDVSTHWFNHYNTGGGGVGYTGQFEKSFLMEDGLPSYASENYSDATINATKEGRDYRWQLFMKAPGEMRYSNSSDLRFNSPVTVWSIGDSNKESSSTGYVHGKGYTLNLDYVTGMGKDATAAVIFRAAEAYLIYIEASYLDKNSIDGDADRYWKALRERAGVDTDYNKTIAATNMAQEALYDWGAYSANTLVDPTLYNIRRERRCEFIGEGRRLDDLLRWRALDQVKGFQIQIA